MAKITFVRRTGQQETVDAEMGTSVMEAALDNDIDEIVAECGGSMSCATCHVYVDDKDLGRLAPPSDTEIAMLEGAAAPVKPSSRLSCQLTMTAGLDGITVFLPEEQY
ncbi:2Fe-2S iron-sulfur cluster-binding protein [Amycolatopsis thermoflava]|uniref:2Fe-2S iron-sulfur cluster-binding protein n=1 Tax=Amycolatopsis thermoflava TaxID=84480 RepID=UPI00040074CE|nr:2Fe-2S iron-sulfur cluster-binding protein [Amycolatopsis thermoflava]